MYGLIDGAAANKYDNDVLGHNIFCVQNYAEKRLFMDLQRYLIARKGVVVVI